MKCPYLEEAKKSLCRILRCSSSAISDVEPHIGLAEPETEAAGNAESPHGGELPLESPHLQVTEGVKGEVAQSCPTLCDPMDYSLPGFSVHGIFQARVLEWVAISFFSHNLFIN